MLLSHLGAIVKALAIIAASIILVWFGLRPATRMLLALPPPQASGAGVMNELPFEPQAMSAFAGEMPFAGAVPEDTPNLISDLTSKMNRTPQKRLEQMVEFDEDQAIAILKQWLRGAQA
jgi:flagellar M-ring protein FliF